MSHECDTSELGPSRFATTDVHRIGILDVRLYNTDRCACNREPQATPKPACTPARSRCYVRGWEVYCLVSTHGEYQPRRLRAWSASEQMLQDAHTVRSTRQCKGW